MGESSTARLGDERMMFSAQPVSMHPITAAQEYGRLDILISNAAVNPSAGRIVDSSADAIDKILDINVKVNCSVPGNILLSFACICPCSGALTHVATTLQAAVLLVKEALPHLQRGSSIVFVSSVTAFK